jgi:hypothetical protein
MLSLEDLEALMQGVRYDIDFGECSFVPNVSEELQNLIKTKRDQCFWFPLYGKGEAFLDKDFMLCLRDDIHYGNGDGVRFCELPHPPSEHQRMELLANAES